MTARLRQSTPEAGISHLTEQLFLVIFWGEGFGQGYLAPFLSRSTDVSPA
jgi:hypothetical protein